MVSFSAMFRNQGILPSSIALTAAAEPSRAIGMNFGQLSVNNAIDILKKQGYSRIHILVPEQGDSFRLLSYDGSFKIKNDEIAVIGFNKDTQESCIVPLRNGYSAEGISSSSKCKTINLLHDDNQSPVLSAEILTAGNISFEYKGSRVAIDPYGDHEIRIFSQTEYDYGGRSGLTMDLFRPSTNPNRRAA
jgi:hypothetical protein